MGISELDEKLLEIDRVVTPQKYWNPTNEENAKKEFFSKGLESPNFEYDVPVKKISRQRTKLQALAVPDSPFISLYNRKIRHIEQRISLMESIGTADTLQKSKEIYGEPKEALVDDALQFLNNSPIDPPEKRNRSSKDLKRHLEKVLANYGLNEWTVKFSDKFQTTVYPSKKEVTVCKRRMYSDREMEKLGVHEVGVHVIRTHNGYQQDCILFALGLPGYVKTEEGLAVLAEQISGLPTISKIREYAARVISVHSRLLGHSFRFTYSIFQELGFSHDDAWTHTLRAYRAGGLIKDHLYFEGYQLMKDYFAAGRPFERLYIGKYGLEDYEEIQRLKRQGKIKEPALFPTFWRDAKISILNYDDHEKQN